MCTILRGKRTTSRLKENKIPGMRQSQVRLGQRIPKRKGNNKRRKIHCQGELNEMWWKSFPDARWRKPQKPSNTPMWLWTIIRNIFVRTFCSSVTASPTQPPLPLPLPLFVWISGIRRTKKLLEVIFENLLVVYTALKVVSARFNGKLNFYLYISKYLRDSA